MSLRASRALVLVRTFESSSFESSSLDMLTMTVLFCVIAVILAGRKWHVVRDRRLIHATIGSALKQRRALGAGLLLGSIYLGIFMFFGGKGGRVHVLFGRLILNATPGEMIAGMAMAVLVGISAVLFLYGVQTAGTARFETKTGIGFAGTFLALLACFCP